METQKTVAILLCPLCGQEHLFEPLQPGTCAKRVCCGATIARKAGHAAHLTAAFSLAALLLYFPANIFPILRLDMYGATSENTVWDGCVRLFKDKDYGVAVIVFMASMLIPLLKLLGLFFLVAATRLNLRRWKRGRFRIYRIIDAVGRWAMLDVFVLAVLVSLVKLQRLATIIPGRGLLCFALVVVFTILASESFDPQLIWDEQREAP